VVTGLIARACEAGRAAAITEQVAALAAKVERLERREQAREDAASFITGGTPDLDALQIIYRAGRKDGEKRTRGAFGVPPARRTVRQASARPSHLRPVDGGGR
jgi:hypothetical protein